jgi:hypothetical protein
MIESKYSGSIYNLFISENPDVYEQILLLNNLFNNFLVLTFKISTLVKNFNKNVFYYPIKTNHFFSLFIFPVKNYY